MKAPEWADIQPKVSAAGLAYTGAVVVMSFLQNEMAMEISATTSAGASGFVMMLAAYLMPNGRHDSRYASGSQSGTGQAQGETSA